MTLTRLGTGVLILVISILGIESLRAVAVKTTQSDGPAARPTDSADDLKGTWSGTFQSRHAEVTPFTITVVIDSDSRGRLVGKASHSSVCLKDVDLYVTVNGSNVSLAGSDQDGSSITFQGTIDKSRTLLNLRYIINGSAGGRCESDDGAGNMGKR